MPISYIGTSTLKPEKISSQIESVSFNSIRNILSDRLIHQACQTSGYTYRQRILGPIVTVIHMITAAIWPEESFTACWQVLWAAVASRYPNLSGKSPSRASLSKARNRLPLRLWQELFQQVSLLAQRVSDKYNHWKGHRLILLDGTCLSMSDQPELRKEFGTNRGQHGQGKFPLIRMVALSLCNTMTLLSYNVGRYDQGEVRLALPLLKTLSKGDLLIADRHFAAAHYYATFKQTGIEFLTRIHQSRKISRIKRLVEYGPNDFVGWMMINPLYRKKDPSLPEKVQVRFTQTIVRIRGQRKTIWLVSSLLNPTIYPGCEIASLYGKRWRIETLFREVKVNFSAAVLRSQSVEGIYKEITAKMIAVNTVRMIMLQAATENRVDPIRISFAGAVRTILVFAPALAVESMWKLPHIYQAMLKQIASLRVPERPGRNEPRAIRREVKHYPSLKTTRKKWRQNYAA